MRRTGPLVLLAVVAAATLPGRAVAADPQLPRRPRARPPIVLALVSGAVTALVPLALGAMYTANARADGPRNVGYAVGGAGAALSPLVAHVVLGEWGRAAAFAAPTVASEAAACALMATHPDAIFHGTTGSRTSFALLFSVDLFGATASLVDVMMAGERATSREREASRWRGLALAPAVTRDRIGFVLGGTL